MLVATDLTKVHKRGDAKVEALASVSLSVRAGELVAITGASGSGKSSLLHLLGGLDRPTSGSVRVDGTELEGLSDRALSHFRRDRLGFVFQFFNLLPTLSAEENIALPALLAGKPLARVRERVDALLERFGLTGRRHHTPSRLSGGEMQRIAIARALVNDPLIILADEPTGNLDSESGAVVLEALKEPVLEGKTVILVTHDPRVASVATRHIRVRDGRVTADES